MEALTYKIQQTAARIRELREISGISQEEMASRTGLTLEEYIACEEGTKDLSIAFLYRCVLILGVDMSDILEGHSPKLRSFALTRKGEGQRIEEAHNMIGYNLAADFRNRIALPLYMEMKYRSGEQKIELTTHEGQECDIVIEGHLMVQVGEHKEVLGPGDSIYYNSDTPHGMIAVNGADCKFYAIVLRDDVDATEGMSSDIVPTEKIIGSVHSKCLCCWAGLTPVSN